MAGSLLETLKALIERTYGMPPLLTDLAPFIVGDRGLRALYGTDPAAQEGAARLLVRETGHGLRAVVYYPDALVRHLERHNPLRGLGDVNITGFSVLVEEVDHLLVLAHRAAQGRRTTRLELEHHAGVTKYLAVVHFLGRQIGRPRLPEPLRLWARHHLFERYAAGPAETEARYRRAARLARRYVDRLDALPRAARRRELLAFERRPFQETQRLLGEVN
ncbi:MAG: hypothetical protein ACRD5D_02090 [Candidatus Polarisedimenticolia bacterium]